jgi:hypothetical protein
VALARESGLQAYGQELDDIVAWGIDDNIIYGFNHANAGISIGRTRFTVDVARDLVMARDLREPMLRTPRFGIFCWRAELPWYHAEFAGLSARFKPLCRSLLRSRARPEGSTLPIVSAACQCRRFWSPRKRCQEQEGRFISSAKQGSSALVGQSILAPCFPPLENSVGKGTPLRRCWACRTADHDAEDGQ